jgi:hypothetical protein
MTKAVMVEINSLANDLNRTISAQVDKARAASIGIDIEPVDPNGPKGPFGGFDGHRICDSGNPWINGLVWADTALAWQFSPFSFHPNALGQTGFATVMQLG